LQGDRRFLDRNIRDPGAAGVATRFIALDGLTPRRLVAPGDTMRCRYHDRGLAVQVAIDD
jgi:hypothetical protein